MKHIFIYVTLFCLALLMVYVIKTNAKTPPIKLYTVDTYYSYILKDDETIDITFYLNTSYLLEEKTSYAETTLHNEDGTKQLDVEISSITSAGSENYLGESYDKYIWSFYMPSMNQSFYLEDGYLNIILDNDMELDLYFGSLSLYYVESQVSYLNWTALSAIKGDTDINRMHQIMIEYDDIDQTIDHINLGVDQEVEFELDQILTLTLPDKNQCLNACPIIITYHNGDIEVIDYFIYIKDYQILKESGLMLYGYLLS